VSREPCAPSGISRARLHGGRLQAAVAFSITLQATSYIPELLYTLHYEHMYKLGSDNVRVRFNTSGILFLNITFQALQK
jgi:hypothetical protein